MSKAFLTYFERQFRLNGKNGDGPAISYLIESKLKQPKEVYPELIRAFRNAAPRTEKNFRRRGKGAYRDLWWHTPKGTVSFEKELSFAVEWFRELIPQINEFRIFVSEIESAILRGDLDAALRDVRDHRSRFGWTVWAVELEIALIDEIKGSVEARNYAAALVEGSSPRLASLMAMIFKDRSDESISLGAFISKCDRSFPSLQVDPPVQEYLYYRAYGYLRNFDVAASAILTMASLNSHFDYYEAFIDLCAAVVFDGLKPEQFPFIKDSCEKLIALGVLDFRLHKLNWLLGGNYEVPLIESEDSIRLRLSQSFFSSNKNLSMPSDPPFAKTLFDLIEDIKTNGSAAQSELSRVYLMGLKYRSLNFGWAISGFANRVNSISADYISSPWGAVSSENVEIGEVLSLNFEHGLSVISEPERCMSAPVFRLQAAKLKHLMSAEGDGEFQELTEIELIWLARQVLREEKYSLFQGLMGQIERRSNISPNQKFALWSLYSIANDDLSSAVELLSNALISDPGRRRELPLISFFAIAKWSHIKSFDTIAVAIVAHHAHLILDDPDTRYAVRMACRSYYKNRKSTEELINSFGSLDEAARARLVEFLREVWVEDNLTMTGFQSTQEVREDRIQVLQALLQIDPDQVAIYREEIKELTFQQNLWKGLKHINETRIFVNEAAINRWAEKELLQEFHRWHSLRHDTKSSVPIVDDIVLKYLVGEDVNRLIFFHEGANLTEADTVLMNLVERLLGRFLMDPADGLNCYLSSRIRHGTLRGTLLGPLEEAGLVGQSNIALKKEPAIQAISTEYIEATISHLRQFESKLTSIVTRLIKEEVQVRGNSSPNGKIYAFLNREYGLGPVKALAENFPFSSFVPTCFELFWSMLNFSLIEISEYFRHSVKMEVQEVFDELIEDLENADSSVVGLITTLRAVATTTQAQCDMIANWFLPNRSLQQQEFSLKEAIEIARSATKNVYRAFSDELMIDDDVSLSTPLTPLGLSAVTDCLYVLFENAWKHSGLEPDALAIVVSCKVGEDRDVLVLSVSNELSVARHDELVGGGLARINRDFIDNASVDMIPKEGGSGLAKIVRLTRRVNRSRYPEPVLICLTDEAKLMVTIHLPIYERSGAYDAYFE